MHLSRTIGIKSNAMLLQVLLPLSGRQKDDDWKTSVTVADPESFSSVKIKCATVFQGNMVSLLSR
jgi:hypothetical protein